MRAFWCPHGHMLECHYPYTCTEAACSHLIKYDYSLEQVAEMEAAAREMIRSGMMPPYAFDEFGNIIIKLSQSAGTEVHYVEENEGWCDGTDDVA